MYLDTSIVEEIRLNLASCLADIRHMKAACDRIINYQPPRVSKAPISYRSLLASIAPDDEDEQSPISYTDLDPQLQIASVDARQLDDEGVYDLTSVIISNSQANISVSAIAPVQSSIGSLVIHNTVSKEARSVEWDCNMGCCWFSDPRVLLRFSLTATTHFTCSNLLIGACNSGIDVNPDAFNGLSKEINIERTNPSVIVTCSLVELHGRPPPARYFYDMYDLSLHQYFTVVRHYIAVEQINSYIMPCGRIFLHIGSWQASLAPCRELRNIGQTVKLQDVWNHCLSLLNSRFHIRANCTSKKVGVQGLVSLESMSQYTFAMGFQCWTSVGIAIELLDNVMSNIYSLHMDVRLLWQGMCYPLAQGVVSYLLYMVWTGIDELQEGGLLDVSVLLLLLKANEVFLSSLAEFHLIETIHFLLHMDGSSTSVHCNKLITRINISYATRFWNVISKGLAPVAPEMNILGIELIDPGIGGHVPGRGKGYSTSIFVVVFSSLQKYKRLAYSDAKQETSLSGRPPSTPILYSTHICKPVYNKDLISASFVIKLKRDVGEAWDHVPVTVVCTTWQLVTHVPILNKYLELAAILLHGNWQYKREVTMTLTAEVQTPTYTQLELRLQCLIWLNTTKLWSYLLRSIVSIKWVTNISTGVVDNAIVAAFCSVAVLSSWSSRMSLQMAGTHRLQLAIRLDSLVGRVVWSTLHCPQPFWCCKSLQDSPRDATCVSSQKISHWIQSRFVYEPGGQSCATFLPFSFVTFTVGGLSVLNAIAGAYSENLPVLYISVGGPTIRVAKAADAFVELADSCGSAVAVMPSAKGLISETHPWLLVVVLGSFSCCWNAGYFVYPPPAIVDELGNWISLQTVSPSWRIRCLGLKQPAWEKADIKWVLLGCDSGCCSECHFSLLRVYCALAEIAWLILYCRGTPLTDNMLEKATLEGLHTVGKYIVFQAKCLNALQHSSVSQQYFGAANGNRRSAVITKLKLFEMIPLLYPRNFVTKLCIAKRGLGDSKTQQPFFITRSWQRLQCGAGVLDCYGSNNRHMSENEMSSEVRYGWALDMGIKHSQYSTLRYYLCSKLFFVSWRCTKHWYYQALVLVTGLLENPELPLNSLALCTTLNGWVFMIAVGFNAAASVRVSNELGASHPKSATFSVTVVTVLSFITSVVITILQLGNSFIWSYTLFSVIHVYMFLVLLLDKVFGFFPGLAQQPRDELLP